MTDERLLRIANNLKLTSLDLCAQIVENGELERHIAIQEPEIAKLKKMIEAKEQELEKDKHMAGE